MTKAKRIGLIVLISLILVGASLGSLALFGTYSEGSRVGRIVKFSKKGVVFKTYEGELSLGGFGKDAQGNISTDKWAFSVYRGDDEIIKQIEAAQSTNAVVELRYKEKFYQFSWRGDTKYFIEEVRPTAQP